MKINAYLCGLLYRVILKPYIKMNIKQTIKEKGYTLERVAEEMGINRVTLSQSLAGNPTIRTLQRIADILGCSVADFFKDEENQHAARISCPHCGRVITLTAEEG